MTGVRTDRGDVTADVVVLACGMWTRQLAHGCGVSVPLHPVEHHYLLSNPTGGDLDDAPVTRDLDGSIYFRGERDTILIGAFQAESKPWLVDEVPADFAFSLLEPDWEHFAAPLEEALRAAADPPRDRLREVRERPGELHAGRQPADGRDAGAASGCTCWRASTRPASRSAAGRARLSPSGSSAASSRSTCGPSTSAASARGTATARSCAPAASRRSACTSGWRRPNLEFEHGRDLRRSPLHDRLAAHGAWFGQKMGAERPNWFAGPGQRPAVEYGFGRQNWFENHQREHAATREAVAMFDQSSFGKLLVSGPDALALLQHLCANDVDVAIDRVVYTAMLNARGTFESDLTVIRTAADRFLLITGTAQIVRDAAWVRRHVRDDMRVDVVDVTARHAVLARDGAERARPAAAARRRRPVRTTPSGSLRRRSSRSAPRRAGRYASRTSASSASSSTSTAIRRPSCTTRSGTPGRRTDS